MQIYPIEPSVTAGQPITLGVAPGSRFALAIYRQQGDAALTYFGGASLAAASDVTQRLIDRAPVFESAGSATPRAFHEDWAWPTVSVTARSSSAMTTGAYVVVAYDVDAGGTPTTELGRRCAAHEPLHGAPPDSDHMALVIIRPPAPSAQLAYIIPIATYHAYNATGGGCFYDDRIHGTTAASKVSLRRPGGGLGARLGEPTDAYDPASPRQQFTHWDAKFIRWLSAQQLSCDFYTDLDLHTGAALDLANYRCMLSVGHHEYWSQAMRDHVARFVAGGGNVAVFGGNTCYRPIDYGDPRTSEFLGVIQRLAEHWPDYNEAQLLGLSYGFGGGKWGDWVDGAWTNTTREPTGFTVQQANHWVFDGCGLADHQTFGDTDRLVGYEADGVPNPSNGFHVLAHSPRLAGWDIGGTAALGIFGAQPSAGPQTKLVFHCGTTDWARVLMDPGAASHAAVARITHNVVRAFIGQTP